MFVLICGCGIQSGFRQCETLKRDTAKLDHTARVGKFIYLFIKYTEKIDIVSTTTDFLVTCFC